MQSNPGSPTRLRQLMAEIRQIEIRNVNELADGHWDCCRENESHSQAFNATLRDFDTLIRWDQILEAFCQLTKMAQLVDEGVRYWA